MRKLLLSLGGFVVAAASYAAPITPEQALSRIGQAGRGAPVSGMPMQNNMELQRTVTASDGMPAVYVFGSDRSQWLIVSADDLARPLLGRLDTAPAPDEPMPVQLESWLADIADAITEARSHENDTIIRLVESSETDPSGEGEESAFPDPISPLLITKWGQDYPYNSLCPQINVSGAGEEPKYERTVTGCVATAMAQIIAHNRYPLHSTGIGTNAAGEKMDLAIEYDYDQMSNSQSIFFPSAVGKLMVACGYSVGMNYGLQASSAQSRAVAKALNENFGYPDAVSLMSSHFSNEEWNDIIYDNLNHGYPVYYHGGGLRGGHAFVIDGYLDGYYHFNWGWNGDYDGYFLIDFLNPGYYDFNRSQGMVANIVPEGSDYRYPVDPYLYVADIEMCFEKITVSVFTPSWRRKTFSFGFIYQNILDPEDKYSQIIYHNVQFQEYEGYSWKWELPKDELAIGQTYRVIPAYSFGDGELVPARVDSEAPNNEFYVKAYFEGYSCSFDPPNRPLIWLDEVPSVIYAGPKETNITIPITLSGGIKNEAVNELHHVVHALLARKINEVDYELAADGRTYCVWLQPGEERVFHMETDFATKSGRQLEPGVYYLMLCDDLDNWKVSGPHEIEIKAYPGFSALSVKEFGTTAPGNVIPADDMSFDVEFVGGEGIYDRQISVAMGIYSSDGRTLVASLQENIVPSILPGESYKWHVKFDSDAVRPGMLYIAAVYGFVPTEEEHHLNFTAISDPLRGKIGEASGIGDVFADEEVDPDEPVYDLTGRMVAPRFAGAQLAPGIYIVGSRKVLVR